MVRRRPPTSQTWRTFLTNHVRQLVSVDLRRPDVHISSAVRIRRAGPPTPDPPCNVTGHPTAAWTAHLRNAFPWDTAPGFLLRDRDGTYGEEFRACLDAMGIDEVLTAPRSPWQNPYVERLIGSMRRECVDHVIVLNERALQRILRSYIDYYQHCPPQLPPPRGLTTVTDGQPRTPTRRTEERPTCVRPSTSRPMLTRTWVPALKRFS